MISAERESGYKQLKDISRERVRKPDDPLCDDQDFMELIRLIKGVVHTQRFVKTKVKRHRFWLGFRVLLSNMDNLDMYTVTQYHYKKRLFKSQNEYQWVISTL